MISSHITQKYQATIPSKICKALDLHGGNFVGFELHNNKVLIRKVTLLDLEFVKGLQQTVNEWSSK